MRDRRRSAGKRDNVGKGTATEERRGDRRRMQRAPALPNKKRLRAAEESGVAVRSLALASHGRGRQCSAAECTSKARTRTPVQRGGERRCSAG